MNNTQNNQSTISLYYFIIIYHIRSVFTSLTFAVLCSHLKTVLFDSMIILNVEIK